MRMANPAIVGSHRVNGVAKLHSELIKKNRAGFLFYLAGKFINQTNGVTPRRWVQQANPPLAAFLHQHLAKEWPTDLQQLAGLEKLADDVGAIDEIRTIKRANKGTLCRLIAERHGIHLDPMAMFDCRVKRIHEYKRQLLNILHVIDLYLEIRKAVKPSRLKCICSPVRPRRVMRWPS